MERVALYMRKSTEVQPWDGQRDVLVQYVADHADLQVVGEYCDVGSGMKVLPDMQKLLEDAREGRFDTVLVASLDRLSRNASNYYRVTDELGSYGIKVVSVDEFKVKHE